MNKWAVMVNKKLRPVEEEDHGGEEVGKGKERKNQFIIIPGVVG